MAERRLAERVRETAFEFGFRVVPEPVRFLVASVDVQRNRFEVQVHGVSVGGDLWVIDRFPVRFSRRRVEDNPTIFEHLAPMVYKEDWRLLVEGIILKSYPLDDSSGRRMPVKAVICDSAGDGRATANAYNFWRWLRDGPQENDIDVDDWPEWVPGLEKRFVLYKGDSKIQSRIRLSYPDSPRKDRHAGARGEIPVLLVSSDSVKNQIDGMLDRKRVDTGRVNFPKWLKLDFYKELVAEVKDEKGRWVNVHNVANESWDLLCMAQALLLDPRHVNIERLHWDDPPDWAAEWDDNDLIFEADEKSPFAQERKAEYTLAQLAQQLG